ncbi:MAG: DUF3570 domain-containing protein [Pseudomonadales bacterium]
MAATKPNQLAFGAKREHHGAPQNLGCALVALTTAAMALPAFSVNQPTETSVALRSSVYQEDPIKNGDETILFGSADRYKIKINQFYLERPVGSDWALNLNYSNEAMSGASPWGASVDSAGDQQVIMSGASIDDSRNKLEGSLTKYSDNAAWSVSVGGSREHDYRSNYAGFRWINEFFQKNTTLTLDASYASDTLNPTDASLYGRVVKASKQSRSLAVGVSQILSRKQIVQLGYGLTKRAGFLSDPYKLRDVRPDNRIEHRLTAGYLHYVEAAASRVRAEYRYYWDSYDLEAHTVELSILTPILDRWEIEPGIRRYQQSAASFFTLGDLYDRPLSLPQSSDFRLSAFGALSTKLAINYKQDALKIGLQYERYRSKPSWGLSGRDAHVALLGYELLSLGIQLKF